MATTASFEPMGIGGILDRAFQLYRQNFIRFLTIVAIVYVPITLISLLLVRVQVAAATEGGAAVLLASLPLLILAIVGQALCAGALIKSVSGTYLGEPISVGEAYKAVLPKLLSLIGAAIVVGLLVGVGLLLLIVPGIIFLLWYILTTQVIVIEDMTAFPGMSRSKQLVAGNLGKVFALGVVVFIIVWIISFAFGQLGGAIAGMAENPTRDQIVRAMTIQTLISQVGSILVAPITAAVWILAYYDLRIRKEGFDLEMLARAMGVPAPGAAPGMAPEAPPVEAQQPPDSPGPNA